MKQLFIKIGVYMSGIFSNHRKRNNTSYPGLDDYFKTVSHELRNCLSLVHSRVHNLNLNSNAIKYTPHNGIINISLSISKGANIIPDNKYSPQNESYIKKILEKHEEFIEIKFINKTIETIEHNISDPYFNVDILEREVGLSHMQFYRKLKSLTGKSGNELIRTLRLKHACDLLKKGLSISESAYKTGFNDPKYFSRCFKEQFGLLPNEFCKEIKGN